MPSFGSKPPPPAGGDGKPYRIRPLKRSDRDAAFKLLALDGWTVEAGEHETAISWVVQHPEMESFVAHDAQSYSRVLGFIVFSHRPQLRLGGRIGCIDAFHVAPDKRDLGIGRDLLDTVLRRAAALACKRIETALPAARDGRHEFFERHGFASIGEGLLVLQRRLSVVS